MLVAVKYKRQRWFVADPWERVEAPTFTGRYAAALIGSHIVNSTLLVTMYEMHTELERQNRGTKAWGLGVYYPLDKGYHTVGYCMSILVRLNQLSKFTDLLEAPPLLGS